MTRLQYDDTRQRHDYPLQARIIAIADAFDALTTDRPYRKASTAAEALDILDRGGGSHFDPELLAIFRSCRSSSKA